MANTPVDKLPPTRYPEKAKTAVITPTAGSTLAFSEITAANSAGVVINVGICEKLHNDAFKAGKYTASTTSYTDDTVDAQSAATNDFNITTTTNGDGFAVQSFIKFNLVGMNVTTAQAGSPVYVYEYYNGSGYTTLVTIEVPSTYTAANQLIVFEAPLDWAIGGPAGKGYAADMYHIRMRATTAPSTAVLASDLYVGKFQAYFEGVSDGQKVAISSLGSDMLVFSGGASLMPYFSTADAGNFVEASYREI